jgi:hypothetical protein
MGPRTRTNAAVLKARPRNPSNDIEKTLILGLVRGNGSREFIAGMRV